MHIYNGKMIRGPWVDASGAYRPAGWVEGASPEQLAEIGVTVAPDIPEPEHNPETHYTTQNDDGTWTVHSHPVDRFIRLCTQTAQSAMDAHAQSWGYDDSRSAITYLDSAVPQFAADATVMRNWRDAMWVTAITVQTEVQAGARPLPASVSEFMALMPVAPTKPQV